MLSLTQNARRGNEIPAPPRVSVEGCERQGGHAGLGGAGRRRPERTACRSSFTVFPAVARHHRAAGRLSPDPDAHPCRARGRPATHAAVGGARHSAATSYSSRGSRCSTVNAMTARLAKPPRDTSLIARGTVIRGDLRFTGALHLDGCIEGSVIADGDDAVFTLSEQGQVQRRDPRTARGHQWPCRPATCIVSARLELAPRPHRRRRALPRCWKWPPAPRSMAGCSASRRRGAPRRSCPRPEGAGRPRLGKPRR